MLRSFLSTQPSSAYKALEGLVEGLPVGSLYLTLWGRSRIGSMPQGAPCRQPETGVHLATVPSGTATSSPYGLDKDRLFRGWRYSGPVVG